MCAHARTHARTPQALNDVKAHLAKQEEERDALQGELAARRRERDGFDKDFSDTQAQTSTVERTYRRLATERSST